MYTKQDLIENKKMNEILKVNRLKMQELWIKRQKDNKTQKLIDKVQYLMGFSLATIIMIGLMYFIALIEALKF